MKVLITGGAGFLGQRLLTALLDAGTLRGVNGRDEVIDEIVLLDVVATRRSDDARVRMQVGDISQRGVVEQAIDQKTQVIFHLAAVVSGQAETDFELGMRINLDASRLILDVCRLAGHRPRVVFTSSVAVYGGAPSEDVGDSTALKPQSSYGVQKAMGELLLQDYTRRGYVDGRVLRLPTISVRPGRPNAAASSFASGIVREPLNGEVALCPVSGETKVWLLSPKRAVECLIRGAEIKESAIGDKRCINLPGLSVTVNEMVCALKSVAGDVVASRIEWKSDPRVEQIVASWPGAWDISSAIELGFEADSSFEDVIRNFIDETADDRRQKSDEAV